MAVICPGRPHLFHLVARASFFLRSVEDFRDRPDVCELPPGLNSEIVAQHCVALESENSIAVYRGDELVLPVVDVHPYVIPHLRVSIFRVAVLVAAPEMVHVVVEHGRPHPSRLLQKLLQARSRVGRPGQDLAHGARGGAGRAGSPGLVAPLDVAGRRLQEQAGPGGGVPEKALHDGPQRMVRRGADESWIQQDGGEGARIRGGDVAVRMGIGGDAVDVRPLRFFDGFEYGERRGSGSFFLFLDQRVVYADHFGNFVMIVVVVVVIVIVIDGT